MNRPNHNPNPNRRKDAPDRYLRHVTITTGDVRDTYRSEVSDDAIRVCRELLDAAIEGEDDGVRVPIPNMPGITMAAYATSKDCLLTLMREDLPLVQVGIATHSRAGASLWRVLTEVNHGGAPIKVDRCPPEPWVAARLEPGIVTCSPDILMMLGDLERCLAWAFIERAEAAN